MTGLTKTALLLLMLHAAGRTPTARSITALCAGGPFRFLAKGIEIEGRLNSGVDVQYPWDYPENGCTASCHSKKAHDHDMHVGAMYVDKHPVTNAEYSSYLQASHYVPLDRANWLRQN